MTEKLQNSAETIHFLEQVSIFSEIANDPQAIKSISTMMTRQHFAKNEIIIEQGTSGNECYVLIEGQVAVHKKTPDGDSYKVVVLSAKDHASFGEGGLMDGEVRSASIIAESSVDCLVLNKKDFAEYCKSSPQYALPIVKKIALSLMARLNQTSFDMMLLHKALMTEIRST